MGRRNSHYGKVLPDITIERAGAEGKSIAHWDGKVVFVSYGAPGDVADLRVTGRKKRFLLAEIDKLKTPSESRTSPRCEHFGLCGGCKWQHLSYSAQLTFKAQQVRDAFDRIGKLDYPEIRPILGSEQEFGYRNKVEYTFCNSRWMLQEEIDSGLELPKDAAGFHMPGRFDKVLHLNTCHLQAEPTNRVRNWFFDYARTHGISFFDVKEKTGFLRNLILRNNRRGEWLLLLVVGEENEKQVHAILEACASAFPEIGNLLYVYNTKANDTIYDLPVHTFKGNAWIQEELGNRTFKIQAKSFFQTNSAQAVRLYDTVKEFASVQKGDVIYDLYCGTGSIGIYLAEDDVSLVGIDSVPDAIRDAYENAALNGIEKVSYTAGDMRNLFNPDFLKEHGRPDVLVTDPPRSGMHPVVVEQLNALRVPKLVYVSCNAATQARDLDLMRDVYRIVQVQPVDMFPHTHHVENVVLLELIES
ncbi:MAG: 23S rRNA (uracil(1939)-C(5))-methyltransferase RlmD [Flavobacteriales bacterium]|nr:23S rRNA (uracil(1939)-C(5))-methyltransferase RlmD [Flavobacteriales bacterium]